MDPIQFDLVRRRWRCNIIYDTNHVYSFVEMYTPETFPLRTFTVKKLAEKETSLSFAAGDIIHCNDGSRLKISRFAPRNPSRASSRGLVSGIVECEVWKV